MGPSIVDPSFGPTVDPTRLVSIDAGKVAGFWEPTVLACAQISS